jgi:hypothetical protein
MISVGWIALLVALGGPAIGVAQGQPASNAVADSGIFTRVAPREITRQESPGSVLVHPQRKVTRQLGELEPVLQWQWGAIFATALAMTGALLLTLPIALVYKWTKPPQEYDPGVMHSSLMLAPTIAGILIVIQGSLALAFSLAGVATAVRFRNSLKDTDDAVYVFVAIAIGMAAGGQALDIALAISLIFSVVVLLLSKSPFRITGNRHHPAHDHHHHHDLTGTAPNGGGDAGMAQAQLVRPMQYGPSRIDHITIRASQPEPPRPAIEAFLDRAAKRWRLDRATRETSGGMTLHYTVRWRKQTPRDLLLEELRTLARSQGFAMEAMPAPVLEHHPDAVLARPTS